MEGVLVTIQAAAAKDRAALVFSVGATSIERMKAWPDYPDDETRPWLAGWTNASFDSATARRIWWSHVSDAQQLLSPTGTGPRINGPTYTTGGVYNPGVTFTGNLDATTKQWVWDGIDTDGDGWADSVAIPTGVTNDHGERYFIAIRIGDTSGLFPLNNCANTYNNTTISSTPRTRISSTNNIIVFHGATWDTLSATLPPGVTFDDPNSASPLLVGKYVKVEYASPLPTLYGKIIAAAGNGLNVDPATPITLPGNPAPRSFEVLLPPYCPGEFNIGAGKNGVPAGILGRRSEGGVGAGLGR
jgi:hypothetical protein